MDYQLINDSGAVEAVIDDNCGVTKFYSIANTLSGDLSVSFLAKYNTPEGVDWNFKYNGHLLKLHYTVYHGISINAINSKDNKVVTDLADMLKKKYF